MLVENGSVCMLYRLFSPRGEFVTKSPPLGENHLVVRALHNTGEGPPSPSVSLFSLSLSPLFLSNIYTLSHRDTLTHL